MPPPLTIPVTIRLRAEPSGRIELIGDFPDWKRGLPMEEVAPGDYRLTLQLQPGLYRYKFRRPIRRYFDDPTSVGVDWSEGHRNCVLIVGGAMPPLYFALDRRHVAHFDDGRLVIQGEVHEASVPESIWVRTDAPVPRALRLPVVPTVQRWGRTGFKAEGRLGPQESSGAFGFEGYPQHVFALPPRRSALGAPPSWAASAVFYGIFLDRWRRSASAERHPRLADRSLPTTPDTWFGGDLGGVTESLDELAALGVDAVVLTPVHPSPTPHRYDSTDLMSVDETLGGEGALKRLLSEAHRRNLRVVVDLAVTHVNEAHPAFQDLLSRQESSPFAPWFQIRSFPVRRRDPFSYRHYYDRIELPLLNLEPGPARSHAVQAALRLVRLGVDGLRLDAMDDAPPDFWEELRDACRAENPELLLLGEVVSDRPARYAEERALDTATDFQHREAVIRFFAKGNVGAEEFWNQSRFAEHRLGPIDPVFRLLFLDNHDTARFLSCAQGCAARLHLALGYLLFRPEPVWLCYGTEALLTAGRELDLQLDDAWPERIPMPDAVDERTSRLIARLCAIRKGLRLAGPVRCLAAQGTMLVLSRSDGTSETIAAFNCGEVPVASPLPEGSVILSTEHDPSAGTLAPLSMVMVSRQAETL